MKRVTERFSGATVMSCIAAAGVLLVAACTSGSTPTTQTGAIPLGFIAPVTGQFSSNGLGALEGAQTAVGDVNANGGVLGRQFLLIPGDDHADATDAIPIIQQQINVNQVVVSFGPVGGSLLAGQRFYDRANIPIFFWGGDAHYDNITDPLMWRTTPSDSQLAVAMTVFATQKGYKTAGMLFSSDVTQQGLKAKVLAAWAKQGGTVVDTEDLSPGQSSYRSEVQKLTKAHPDVIFTAMGPTDGAVVFSNMKELNGLTIPIVGDDNSGAPDFTKAVGLAAAQKVLSSCDIGVISGPSTDYFNTLYKKVNSHPPLPQAIYAYDDVILAALAMQKAGSLDAKAIVGAIPSVSDPAGQQVHTFAEGVAALKGGAKTIKYIGASGPLDFNANHNVYGPFGCYKATDLQGNHQLLINLTAEQLQAATP